MKVVVSLSQGRTAAAQCGLFTHKSVPVIFEPPCILQRLYISRSVQGRCSFRQTEIIPESQMSAYHRFGTILFTNVHKQTYSFNSVVQNVNLITIKC